MSANPGRPTSPAVRVLRAALALPVGMIGGAIASAAVGAGVGLVCWVMDFEGAYDWADWPIVGAGFGLIVGAVGGLIGAALRCAGSERGAWLGRRRGWIVGGLALADLAVVALAPTLGGDLVAFLFYPLNALIGGWVGAWIGWRVAGPAWRA